MTQEPDPEVSRSQLLERVGRPVFILDSNGQILSGNAESRNIGLSPGKHLASDASGSGLEKINSDWLQRPADTARMESRCAISTAHGEVDFVVQVERWSSEHYVWCLCPGNPPMPEPLIAGYDDLVARLDHHLDETDTGAAVFALELDGLEILEPATQQVVLELAITRIRAIASEAFVAITGLKEIALVHGHRDVITHAAMTADMIRDALALPYEVDDQKIILTASVGVAIGWPALSTAEALVADAESARNSARERGESHIEVFDDSLRTLQVRKVELLDALKAALKSNQIELQYQAIVELPSEKWISLEGYMRWMDREMGFVAPMDIIPAAERGDLIQALGRQVVNVACSDLNKWRQDTDTMPLVWINVSVRELLLPHFIGALQMQLSEHGVAAKEIGLDVPVAALNEDPSEALKILNELKEMGVAVALDDVDELSVELPVLSDLAITAFKLDRNLLWGIHSREGSEIIRSILRRSTEMGAVAIAKGVETPEQRDVLIRLGVEFAQGFLFAKPQEVSQVEISRFGEVAKSQAPSV